MKRPAAGTMLASSCLALLFVFQGAALVRCHTEVGFLGYSKRYFCWAPNDQLSVYSTRVVVRGRELSPAEVYRRYGDDAVDPILDAPSSGAHHAWTSTAFQHAIDRITAYEATHADRADVVEVAYEVNGRRGVWNLSGGASR